MAELGPAGWHHGDGRLGWQCAVLGCAAGHPHGCLPGTLAASLCHVTILGIFILPPVLHLLLEQQEPQVCASFNLVAVQGQTTLSASFMQTQLILQQAEDYLTLQVHAADVLAMAASPAGDAVFAAGIDPQLALYKRVPGNKG